ncbi:MAG: exostosin family protein [Candidatus Peribacteraceae bacterium]|jgi:hypothetical protein
MIKVFIKLLPPYPHVPLLYPNLGKQERQSILFLNNAFAHLEEPIVHVTENPRDADFFLLPHNYSGVRRETAYLKGFADLARRHGKKTIVIAHGDSSAPIPFPDAVIFRTSQYAYEKRGNEITMPAYAEDLLGGNPLMPRPLRQEPPVVGFCGWTEYKDLKNRAGTLARDAWVTARSILTRRPELLAETKGITLRRRALAVLECSGAVRPNIIRRGSYSGHASTIKMDPSRARWEYVDNMLQSDFSLVVKGDGNYSYRFYETLSLGRVPLFLNTACRLPLEDVVDYGAFTVFVEQGQMHRLADVAAERYRGFTPEGFLQMQRRAREAFEKYLRVDSFFRYAVEHLL